MVDSHRKVWWTIPVPHFPELLLPIPHFSERSMHHTPHTTRQAVTLPNQLTSKPLTSKQYQASNAKQWRGEPQGTSHGRAGEADGSIHGYFPWVANRDYSRIFPLPLVYMYFPWVANHGYSRIFPHLLIHGHFPCFS